MKLKKGNVTLNLDGLIAKEYLKKGFEEVKPKPAPKKSTPKKQDDKVTE